VTTSETARHGRAELETLAAGLQVSGLARLIELARRLLEEQDAPRVAVELRERA
jgi:hypothetical protein